MSHPSKPQVRVGVGVFILSQSSSNHSNTSVLLGRRKGSHGSGTYALPGGHLEFNESFSACATREVLEETGLHIQEPKFLTATNDIMVSEGKHYVTIFMCSAQEDEGQEARNLEEEKCEGWEWVRWEEIVRWAGLEESGGEGRKLFTPLLNLVRQRRDIVPRY